MVWVSSEESGWREDGWRLCMCVCVCVRRGGVINMLQTPRRVFHYANLLCLLPQVKEFAPVSGVFVLITVIRQESSSLKTSLMTERCMLMCRSALYWTFTCWTNKCEHGKHTNISDAQITTCTLILSNRHHPNKKLSQILETGPARTLHSTSTSPCRLYCLENDVEQCKLCRRFLNCVLYWSMSIN